MDYLIEQVMIDDELTNQKIEAYQNQVDALYAYLDFQNKQVGIISDFIEKGGIITPKLNAMVDDFQKKGLVAFETYISKQKRIIRGL
jgi:hypothetical protein